MVHDFWEYISVTLTDPPGSLGFSLIVIQLFVDWLFFSKKNLKKNKILNKNYHFVRESFYWNKKNQVFTQPPKNWFIHSLLLYILYIYIYIHISIYKGKKHFLKGFDGMFPSVISHILVILQYSLKSKTLTEGR